MIYIYIKKKQKHLPETNTEASVESALFATSVLIGKLSTFYVK